MNAVPVLTLNDNSPINLERAKLSKMFFSESSILFKLLGSLIHKEYRMTQQPSINPYAAPEAEIEAPGQTGDLVFCDANKLKGGDGNRFVTEAWTIYKKAPIKWTVISLFLFALVIVVSLIPIIGSILGSIVFIPFFAGLYIGAEEVSKGENLRFSHLFAGFKARGLKLIGFSLVYSVLYLVAFLGPFLAMGATEFIPMMLGEEPNPEAIANMGANFALVFLVVMGLMIPLIMAYWFAIPLIAFQNDGIFQALGKSFKACLKNFWPLTIYGLVIMFWFFLAIIPLGLGLLIILPILTISIYTSYRKIFTQ